MKEFNSFEEISAAYPLDNKANKFSEVRQFSSYVLTETDLAWVKEVCPHGWLEPSGHEWHYYQIHQETWYDCYIYDGEKWILGIDSWDGIRYAEEPKWGVHYTQTIRRSEFGVFRTMEEASEYRDKKLKERLEF